jgi:DnaJ-class molecular chaperone
MGVIKRFGRIVRAKLVNHGGEFQSGEKHHFPNGGAPSIPDHRWAYGVLEIHEGASKEEVRKSYLRLARKYHPDNFLGQDDKLRAANELMAIINKAYELLTS